MVKTYSTIFEHFKFSGLVSGFVRWTKFYSPSQAWKFVEKIDRNVIGFDFFISFQSLPLKRKSFFVSGDLYVGYRLYKLNSCPPIPYPLEVPLTISAGHPLREIYVRHLLFDTPRDY